MATRFPSDAWGEDELNPVGGWDVRGAPPSPRVVGPAGKLYARTARKLLPEVLQPAAAGTWAQRGDAPTLRALCLGFLGRHLEAVVAQLGRRLAPLPADVKACLLCVARRRGILTNRVLLSLADDGWNLLDLRGATALSERAVRQALLRCPHLRALDLTGVDTVTTSLLRDLPALCPSVELLVVGGGNKATEAALLEVLPDMLPHVRVTEQQEVEESWEDTAAGGRVRLPDPGVSCGLPKLKLLVWPQAPALATHVIKSVCPRVELSPNLPVVRPPPPHHGPSNTRSRGVEDEVGDQAETGASLTTSILLTPATDDRPGGIKVLRVRTAGDTSTSGGRPFSAPQSLGKSGSGVGGPRERAGAGRYTAPHLRRGQLLQLQQQQPRHQVRPPDEAQAVARRDVLVPAAGLMPGASATVGTESVTRQQSNVSSCAAALGPPPPLPQLDDCLAWQVSDDAWEGLGGGEVQQAEEELHIAEKFRLAYEEQDARLRAKAQREAALADRKERQTSLAARVLAQWLDEE